MQAYIFNAALYCEPCGQAICERTTKPAGMEPENESTWDSGDWPKGPFEDGGGEADSPQHCDACNAFLRNPLTADGLAYVRGCLTEAEADGAMIGDPLATWADFYADEIGEMT